MTDQMNVAAELLRAEFDNGEVLQFQGRGGKTFDYIEDETVMDRLDEVLGIGTSSFEFEPVGNQCVKGTLIVTWPNGERSHYQDFGYATRPDSAEPLKEAVSDAIRRLGRYVGVARYLYRKHAPASPTRPQAAPQRTQPVQTVNDPYADLPNDWETPGYPAPARLVVGQTSAVDEGYACPEHGLLWTLKPAGTSKAGKAYDAFWKCDGRTNDEFCKAKPTKAWQARQEG